MAQQDKIGKRATRVYHDILNTCVTYHETVVVTFDDNQIILNSGGWRTQTTKTRMNQASNQFGLGYCVFQKDGDWFVRLESGIIFDFQDNMVIDR